MEEQVKSTPLSEDPHHPSVFFTLKSLQGMFDILQFSNLAVPVAIGKLARQMRRL
jgi:hypothetical protein